MADRIRHLVAQACELPPDTESPVIAELCDLVYKGNSTALLEVCVMYLRSTRGAHAVGAMNMLHQVVLSSLPSFASQVSQRSFMDVVFEVASMTADRSVRDTLVGRVVKWASVYNLPGFSDCVMRMRSHPNLMECVQQQTELSRQQSIRRHADPSRGPISPGLQQAPLRTPPSSSSFNPSAAQASPNNVVGSPNNNGFRPLTRQPSSSSMVRPPQQQIPFSAAGQQQQQVPVSVAQQQVRQRQTLSTLEAFIMEAQGDLASLEYSLEHPGMMDASNVGECRRHLHKSRMLIDQFPDMGSDNKTLLVNLSDRLLEIINLYAAITGAQPEKGGTDAQQQRTAAAAATIKQQATAVVNHEAIAAQATAEAIKREKEAIEKLIEAERKETQDLRSTLETTRRSKEELQAKYKEAKEKNKQLINLVEEYGARVDELEEEKASGGGGDAKVATITETKVVVQKPKVSKAVLTRINDDILDLRRGLRHIKEISLKDLSKEMALQSIQIQGAIVNKLLDADNKGRKAEQAAMQKLQELYRKEVKLRKQYYNTIQELKGNIRVYCRVRPMSGKELSNGHTIVAEALNEDELKITDERGSKVYEFDNVFGGDTTQEKVFEDTAPLIDSVVDGYNVCIFAYGQTGSGKTHTMQGGSGDSRGINRRALDRLFNIIAEREETEESTVTVSVLEIYCEQIRDLLVPKQVAAKNSYEIKIGGQYGNYVNGLKEVEVKSASDVEEVLSSASGNRSEGQTDMNAHSSRSHMVLYIIIKSKNKHTGALTYGKLSLVDLAGSERLDKSNATGQGAKEAIAINKSLSALGDVIGGLSTGNKHIPFRNSQLTFLLQDSMSGQAKVLMFCCISPASYNVSESTSSLMFASRARGVSLGPVKKNAT